MGMIKVALPALPPPEFFNQAEHTIMTDDGTALLSYDAKTRSGFVYHIERGYWSISAPVDFNLWVTLAKMAGYAISESEDARRWFRACCPNPAGENVVDFFGASRH